MGGPKRSRSRLQIGDRFDIFLTIDKGFEFERDVRKLDFGIIVLTAANNQMASYESLLEDLVQQIGRVSTGQVIHVIDPFLNSRP